MKENIQNYAVMKEKFFFGCNIAGLFPGCYRVLIIFKPPEAY